MDSIPCDWDAELTPIERRLLGTLELPYGDGTCPLNTYYDGEPPAAVNLLGRIDTLGRMDTGYLLAVEIVDNDADFFSSTLVCHICDEPAIIWHDSLIDGTWMSATP